MASTTDSDISRFYSLLDRLGHSPAQGRPLRDLPRKIPVRGVYFFFESGELRSGLLNAERVVRVGTHAVSRNSRSTLRARLRQHLGTRVGWGNHRGSIFRLHVGAALLSREGKSLPTWGVGSSKPDQLRNSEHARAAEAELEVRVSTLIGAMRVLWISVPDEPGPSSERAYIERNAIALLSNHGVPLDPPSETWLGRCSPRQEIRDSGLWNLKYVNERYDAAFLDRLEDSIARTMEWGPD